MDAGFVMRIQIIPTSFFIMALLVPSLVYWRSRSSQQVSDSAQERLSSHQA